MRRLIAHIFLLLALAAPAVGTEPRWEYVGKGADSTFYIDRSSVTYPEDNTVRVWVRWSLDPGSKRFRAERKRGVGQILTVEELDCLHNRVRTMSALYRGKAGELLKSAQKPSEWDYVVPESELEAVQAAVCPPVGRQYVGSEPAGERIKRLELTQEALVNVLERRGVVGSGELAEELLRLDALRRQDGRMEAEEIKEDAPAAPGGAAPPAEPLKP